MAGKSLKFGGKVINIWRESFHHLAGKSLFLAGNILLFGGKFFTICSKIHYYLAGNSLLTGRKYIIIIWREISYFLLGFLLVLNSPTTVNYLPGYSVQWREEPLHCCCLLSVWSGGDHHHQEPGGVPHHQEPGGDPHHLEKEVQLFHQWDLFLESPLHP